MDHIVTISDLWLTQLISVFIPIIVAVVTKQVASGTVKSVILIFLSVLTGWLTSLQATNGEFEVKVAAQAVLLSFVVAVATHFGFLKPAGVTGSSGKVQAATANFGVGSGGDTGV